MSIDKSLITGSIGMLLLKLLEEKDMYGYQMIEQLRRRSDHTFDLKAGTLYPLLHALEEKGFITSWVEETDSNRPRKYYHLSASGKEQLLAKKEEWEAYTGAVNRVLRGGAFFA
ncbi:PadR family transcriptional regulator [Oscillibacter sp.]|uniref:PadR family transcriptional regulator n=1 Tax=Oscillibacter sp. TaxID=1945593 RepID=UPI0026082DE8|nr:helix-turn-helix transcriptional regulator [Oscillibacter sp.]MDD3346876.1 helix-turn-helix transcriptional regulator [Oscillibacter sp.]